MGTRANTLKLLILGLVVMNSYAEPIKTLVEFFSFKCQHCSDINASLEKFVAKNNIKYLDVNVDNDDRATPTNIMYYIAIDAGIGSQFKSKYFEAVTHGMEEYSSTTLNYVFNQVKTLKMIHLLKSKAEQEHVKQKLIYANNLLSANHVRVTPTFLINQTILLEGTDVINSLESQYD